MTAKADAFDMWATLMLTAKAGIAHGRSTTSEEFDQIVDYGWANIALVVAIVIPPNVVSLKYVS